ncbi:MAG: sodium/proline symporter [Candidatus Eremiobacteraeota bacterium]|nr:sodium/proline symporter [Candidatus Eremiobacteraeota bacterium]
MNQVVVVGSFVFFLVLFTLVGVLSARKKQATSEDYLVASRNVNPWLTALSAVSTNNSGYMFIGLIGFAWRAGLEAIWITLGFIVGDFLTWLWVHRRVRAQSEKVGAASVPSLLATDHLGQVSRPIAVVTGALTFFFLGGYAAAQLKAGSTTLNALFGWPLWAGSVIGVVVVTIYCLSGGIRASIWTDSVQSVVMIGSMTLLLGYCFVEVGGKETLFAQLAQIDPKLVEWTPRNLKFGLSLYLLGFTFAGVGVIGQPHILIRFMAIDAVDSIKKARNIYFVWYTLFSIAALAVGLYARVLLPNLTEGLTGTAAVSASESALPALAVTLLPSVFIGLMLAGIFSATMSTADSQILSCSAAVTQDMFPRWQNSYTASKVATLSVALVALVIALTASSGVFSLVLVAWSALAASLGPILIIRLAKLPLPTPLALAMIVAGLATVFYWGSSAFADDVFKALPGMMLPLALYGAVYGTIRKRKTKTSN